MSDRQPFPRAHVLSALQEPRQFISSLIAAVSGPLPALAQSAAHCAPANPLQDGTAETRNIFLALHVVFPDELLPALDVLDRGRVVRLRASLHSPLSALDHAEPNLDSTGQQPLSLLLVRSVQQQQQHRHYHSYSSSSSSTHPQFSHEPCYEVRLDAWSCSCPAFTFAAFPAARDRPNVPSPRCLPFSSSSSVLAPPDGTTDEAKNDSNNSNNNGNGNGNIGMASITTAPACLPQPAKHTSDASLRFGGCTHGGAVPPVCKHLLACVLVEQCAAFAHLVEDREVSLEEMAGWAAGWGD